MQAYNQINNQEELLRISFFLFMSGCSSLEKLHDKNNQHTNGDNCQTAIREYLP